MKTMLLGLLIFLDAVTAHAGCAGNYLADKDKSGDFDPQLVSARTLVEENVGCGIKNVEDNGWTGLGFLSTEQVRKQLSTIDIKYVDQIPVDKLPPEQRERRSGCYHIVENGHWSIYIVPEQLRTHHMGENILLAFHELVSTLVPFSDQNYALTMEYEMKMLQKRDDSLDKLGVGSIVFPLIPVPGQQTSGIITSGGGDLDTIWIKRQLRNYVFDILLPDYLAHPTSTRQTELTDLVTAVSDCPVEVDHSHPQSSTYTFDDQAQPPRLLVGPEFLQKTFSERCKELGNDVQARTQAYRDAVTKLMKGFAPRARIWAERCQSSAF